MKTLLFCQNPYAFGILDPLAAALRLRGHELLWYIPEKIGGSYQNSAGYQITSSITDCYNYRPDAIFVPGNEVPHYLTGVKIQVFHGFAGEKKGHFRIRHYFDLYLTQGPWFTGRFKELAARHRNFRVVETGWCKLDPLFSSAGQESPSGSAKAGTEPKTILYAPTFSPSLTSAGIAFDEVVSLAKTEGFRVVIKFHDLTAADIIAKYEAAAAGVNELVISTDKNLVGVMRHADLMISDTSSAVYEFLLMDRPVITINSRSSHIRWENLKEAQGLKDSVMNNLENDPFRNERRWIMENYHPYGDGKSSFRMIDATEDYINNYGIPEGRKLPLGRRLKMNSMFGKEISHVR